MLLIFASTAGTDQDGAGTPVVSSVTSRSSPRPSRPRAVPCSAVTRAHVFQAFAACRGPSAPSACADGRCLWGSPRPPPLLSPSAAAGRGQRPQSAEPEEPLTLGAAWRAGRGAEGRVPRGTRARRSPPPAVFLLSESGVPGSPPVCAEWSDTLPPQRLRRGSPGLEPRPSPPQPREPPARTPCSPGSGALCLSSARAHRAARVSGRSFWKPGSLLSRTVWCLPVLESTPAAGC